MRITRGAGEAIHPSIDKDADRRMDENAIEEWEKVGSEEAWESVARSVWDSKRQVHKEFFEWERERESKRDSDTYTVCARKRERKRERGWAEDPDYSASTRFAIDILFLSPLIILCRSNRADLFLFVREAASSKGRGRRRETSIAWNKREVDREGALLYRDCHTPPLPLSPTN